MGWLSRPAIVLMAVLLGGGPAAVAACERGCLPLADTPGTAQHGTHGTAHRHAQAIQTGASANEAGPSHAHGPGVQHGVLPPEAGSTASVVRDCCQYLGRATVALTASRLERDRLPGPHVLTFSASMSPAMIGRQAVAPATGFPPGEFSPFRAPHVLRI